MSVMPSLLYSQEEISRLPLNSATGAYSPQGTWEVAGHRRGASEWRCRQPRTESGSWRSHAPEARLGGKRPRAAIRRGAEPGRKKPAGYLQARAPPAPLAPPARARAAGGSAASRTSGCCLIAAAARLWSPGRRRRRCRRLGSWSQERRHRHGRHQRWAWDVGRQRTR